MKHRLLTAILAAAAPLCAATASVTIGSALPKTCTTGSLFFLTGAPAGQNIYGCVDSNSWALQGIGPGVVIKAPSSGGTTGGIPAGPNKASVAWANPPSGLSVPAKQSLTIAVDRPAKWTLQTGSRGSIAVSGQNVTYSAPSLRPQNSIAGCQVLPSDSVYSTPIDKLPVHAQSAAWIKESMGISAVSIGFGEAWGHNVVDSSLAPVSVAFYYTASRNGAKYQLLSGNNRNRETGALATDGNNDHHMVVINHQTCHFYETYHDYLSGLEPSTYTANSGYDYSSSNYDQPTDGTTDAAGLPLTPLMVHLSEFEAGAIHHPLRFTSCAGCINAPALWPAVGSTAATPGAAPMGSRWRLKASFDISHFSPNAQVVLKALQQYGMILADIGMMQQIQVDDDVNQDPALARALGEISGGQITQDKFEIVDESSFMVSRASNRVNPTNGYNTPLNYVVLNGVDGSGNKLTLPISIQPVMVGVPNETLHVQAGVAYQMSAWVNNAADQGVTWTLTSGPGVISPTGVYTPPATITGPTAFVVTGTSVADPSATAQVRGFVIPNGAIRIDVGNYSPYTDSQGNAWMADTLGTWTASYNNDDETYSYPASKWGIPDAALWGKFKYTWGDDISYGPFAVPNGTYNVQFYFAEPNCTGTYDRSRQFDNGLITGGQLGLDVNGSLTMFDIGASTKNTCLVPAIGTVQAVVTNNLLTVAVRATGGPNAHQAPFLNALAILPQ